MVWKSFEILLKTPPSHPSSDFFSERAQFDEALFQAGARRAPLPAFSNVVFALRRYCDTFRSQKSCPE
jgi:hypothetical protein